MKRFYFLIAMSIASFYFGSATECEYYVSPTLPTSFQLEEEINKSGNVSEDGTFMTCLEDYAQCMTLWTFDQYEQNLTTVLVKGCWKGNGECERKQCIANEDINPKFLNNSRFCCCSSPRCNSDYVFIWMPRNFTRMTGITDTSATRSGRGQGIIVAVGVSAFVVLIALAIVAACIYRSWTRNREQQMNEKLIESAGSHGTDRERLLHGSDNISPQPKLFLDADQIELLEIISRGRFSIVWKSLYKTTGEYVAVKIYPPTYRQYFNNENRIYSWTGMEHESIVRFYGGAERSVAAIDDSMKSAAIINQLSSLPLHHQQVSPQYWIVTAYMPQGTLQDFLKANTVDWVEMCRMGASIAGGLSYLHGHRVSGCGDGIKPPIVHRDVNSRNILVNLDGTCVLCDFGFALALEEPKPGTPNPHGDTPLTEVGTVRYFAPEILEGAVNLRDPATSLKQVDVYALGLVLWEIISRCGPLHRIPGMDAEQPIPEYQPPFAKEISPHPTLEQMQLWVCKKKVRPLFQPAFYKSSNGVLRVLRVLVEDCWDSDSDARITASCAHERLVSLQNLPVFGGVRDQDALKPPGTNDFVSSTARYLSYPELRRPIQYSGGESTADTLATGATSGVGSMGLISSDRARSINSSSLGYHMTSADSPATLQPYQGRNPCMERNLLVESSDDSSNAKNRITESPFQKIDPCSPDTFARFASPALLALASQGDDSSRLVERRSAEGWKNVDFNTVAGATKLSAVDKSNTLAMLLMKSEKNKTARDDANGNGQRESEFLKQNDHAVETVPDPARSVALSTPMVDFRGSVSGSSNDSGNCTTTSSNGSGSNSANGSPRLRPADGKNDHRVPV